MFSTFKLNTTKLRSHVRAIIYGSMPDKSVGLNWKYPLGARCDRNRKLY